MQSLDRNAKIGLGIIAGIIIGCLCIVIGGSVSTYFLLEAFADHSFMDDPEKASAAAQEILDYTLPDGYREQAVMDFWVVKMAILSEDIKESATYSSPVIMLMQIPVYAGLTEDEMREQMKQGMARNLQQQSMNLQLVDTRLVRLRDQDVSLFYYQGTDQQGNPIRQVVSSAFRGKNGMVMIMILGNEDGWRQENIDAFFTSIH